MISNTFVVNSNEDFFSEMRIFVFAPLAIGMLVCLLACFLLTYSCYTM